jgi:hypothetical protein
VLISSPASLLLLFELLAGRRPASRRAPEHGVTPFAFLTISSIHARSNVVHLPARSTSKPPLRRWRAHLWAGCGCIHLQAAFDAGLWAKISQLTPCTTPSTQVRDANVVAALSIANVVKSSLGPVGLDKSASSG